MFSLKKRRKKLTPEDFDPVNIIGRGAFGEVRLCKWKETGEIVVIKKMKKSEMVFKNQVTHIRAERDVLAAANILWIVELKCSFQVAKKMMIGELIWHLGRYLFIFSNGIFGRR